MARPLRYHVPGGIYHVTTRGNERREIVRNDRDRKAFVTRLADIVLECRWILHAWVLMTNHVHLVVETPVANLSQGMRDLLGPFAGRFNSVHERVGHLFQHRFHAKPVERETHLLELVRYVPLNPVRAGLVKSPGQWRWGSYRATAGYEAAPHWLEIDWTLSQFHPDRATAQEQFREFVRRGRDVAYDPEAEAVGGWILGSTRFCQAVQRWVDEARPTDQHPKRQRHLHVPELRRLLDLIRSETARDDFSSPWDRGPARKLIADLGHAECGLTFEVLATTLETSGWGAGKLRKRSRELAQTDEEYAALRERIRRALRAEV